VLQRNHVCSDNSPAPEHTTGVVDHRHLLGDLLIVDHRVIGQHCGKLESREIVRSTHWFESVVPDPIVPHDRIEDGDSCPPSFQLSQYLE